MSNKMTHPKIPPTAKYFFASDGIDTMNFSTGDFTWCLCHAVPHERKIIASMARCEWWEHYFLNGGDEAEFTMSSAWRYSEQWRKWGNGEKWE